MPEQRQLLAKDRVSRNAAQGHRAEATRLFREAEHLADQKLCRCNACKRVQPLQNALITLMNGHVAFSLCEDCIQAGVRVDFHRTERGYLMTFKVPRGTILPANVSTASRLAG